MNTLGLDRWKNTKVRIPSVRIVASFDLQILHLPRFLTPLAISHKFYVSPPKRVSMYRQICDLPSFQQLMQQLLVQISNELMH